MNTQLSDKFCFRVRLLALAALAAIVALKIVTSGSLPAITLVLICKIAQCSDYVPYALMILSPFAAAFMVYVLVINFRAAYRGSGDRK